ncbi:MAG: DUF1501 domain-containing protein, partial [Bacteroidota bacterium]
GGLGTRFFVVEIGGFDTHANQPDAHANLLNSVASNVKAFFSDLSDGGIDDRVLAMTISEFGRRIFENGSNGTDHGAAAPMMLFGKGLNGNGMIGGLPDLQNLTRGNNLRHSVDFRAIYATLLSNWLCIDGDMVNQVMGQPFDRIDELGLACQGTTSNRNPRAASIGLNAFVTGGEVVLEYELPANSRVGVHFFDVAGRKLSSPLVNASRRGGVNRERFALNNIGWSSGVYVVSLEVNGRMYSRKLGMFR